MFCSADFEIENDEDPSKVNQIRGEWKSDIIMELSDVQDLLDLTPEQDLGSYLENNFHDSNSKSIRVYDNTGSNWRLQ